MDLSPEQQRWRASARRNRKEVAETLDISEGQAAARTLSPTISGFFSALVIAPLVESGTPIAATVDKETTRRNWGDERDADELFLELQAIELIEEIREGELALTPLGHEALIHLFDN